MSSTHMATSLTGYNVWGVPEGGTGTHTTTHVCRWGRFTLTAQKGFEWHLRRKRVLWRGTVEVAPASTQDEPLVVEVESTRSLSALKRILKRWAIRYWLFGPPGPAAELKRWRRVDPFEHVSPTWDLFTPTVLYAMHRPYRWFDGALVNLDQRSRRTLLEESARLQGQSGLGRKTIRALQWELKSTATPRWRELPRWLPEVHPLNQIPQGIRPEWRRCCLQAVQSLRTLLAASLHGDPDLGLDAGARFLRAMARKRATPAEQVAIEVRDRERRSAATLDREAFMAQLEGIEAQLRSS